MTRGNIPQLEKPAATIERSAFLEVYWSKEQDVTEVVPNMARGGEE